MKSLLIYSQFLDFGQLYHEIFISHEWNVLVSHTTSQLEIYLSIKNIDCILVDGRLGCENLDKLIQILNKKSTIKKYPLCIVDYDNLRGNSQLVNNYMGKSIYLDSLNLSPYEMDGLLRTFLGGQ